MRRSQRIVGIILPLFLLGGLVFAWFHRWDIYDFVRLRNYQPSTKVVSLASSTTMNDKARRVFYVYHPELDDKAAFNRHCSNTERTIVLGCYVSGQGIYVYNVTEPRLQGIVEVTSAHEMLHAAYERLGSSDKKRINNLLSQAYDKVTDQRIRDNIDDYRKNGADITNELHSILGSEVRSLPPELEQYYTRYFTDRLNLVSYSEKYEQAFAERKQQVANDDLKLQELKQQIDAAQSTLANQKTALDSGRGHLDNLLATKQFEAYNSGVPAFNRLVNSFNIQARNISHLIDEYNMLVSDRNAIAVEEGELVKAIDSRPSTIESQ